VSHTSVWLYSKLLSKWKKRTADISTAVKIQTVGVLSYDTVKSTQCIPPNRWENVHSLDLCLLKLLTTLFISVE
jgi:hypothetical protein